MDSDTEIRASRLIHGEGVDEGLEKGQAAQKDAGRVPL